MNYIEKGKCKIYISDNEYIVTCPKLKGTIIQKIPKTIDLNELLSLPDDRFEQLISEIVRYVYENNIVTSDSDKYKIDFDTQREIVRILDKENNKEYTIPYDEVINKLVEDPDEREMIKNSRDKIFFLMNLISTDEKVKELIS